MAVILKTSYSLSLIAAKAAFSFSLANSLASFSAL
jgi:hypothetical protein